MRYKYILLDSDNTLMDFDAAEDYAIEKTLQELKLPCTDREKRVYSETNAMLWERFNHGQITKKQLMSDRFRIFFKKMGFPDMDYEKINQQYKDNLGGCAVLIPGALEFCREMSQECRLYILTNGAADVQTRRFEASPLTNYISEIFISELTGYQKPQKEYFDYVFARIPGFKKEEAIMIGDSLSSDIAGANRAGVTSCWYNPSGRECDSQVRCDYMVTNYEQMKQIIRGERQ